MKYINEVYHVAYFVRKIRDSRKKIQIKTGVTAYLLIFAFVLRVSSFNRMKYLLEDNKTRFLNLIPYKSRLPKIDAIRESVKQMYLEDVRKLHSNIINKAADNKVLRENTITGLRVVAIDGVELFNSKVKQCCDCLIREIKGEPEYYHRAVMGMTVGRDPHIALGIEMFKSASEIGSDKDEGELTAAKRLLKNLYREYNRFADVIVADALFMNAPFINTVKNINMDVVIRAKDTRLHIVQDALGLFKKRPADAEFNDTKKQVFVWDEDNFSMPGCEENIRFLKFEENWISPKGKKMHREMWCITTLKADAHTVWLIMRKRWDIENNGFRMLKTYFHADHNFIHYKDTNEKILLFILAAFNLTELFMFRRLINFRKNRMLRINIISSLFDQLYMYDMSHYFINPKPPSPG